MQRTLPIVIILNFTEQTSYHIVYLSFKKLEVEKNNEIFYTFRMFSRFAECILFACLYYKNGNQTKANKKVIQKLNYLPICFVYLLQ